MLLVQKMVSKDIISWIPRRLVSESAWLAVTASPACACPADTTPRLFIQKDRGKCTNTHKHTQSTVISNLLYLIDYNKPPMLLCKVVE
jgi:hypothetical protein